MALARTTQSPVLPRYPAAFASAVVVALVDPDFSILSIAEASSRGSVSLPDVTA